MSPVNNMLNTLYRPQPAPPTNRWTMPVVGMQNAPSQYQPGGAPAWGTGSFGYKKPASKGGHTHKGVDIYAERGAQIVAPVNGTIKSIGDGKISGNYVKVQGDDGREYYFAHMDNVHTGISTGMRVKQGAYLGGVGNSGNASGTSTHLHFEIREGGKAISPNEFIRTGRQQDTIALSSIPGLNSVGQLQSYIDEDMRAQQYMNSKARGFDPATWGQDSALMAPEDAAAIQKQAGSSMLSSTFNMLSEKMAGGQRTPLARSSAMGAVEGGAPPPTAAMQRQETPDATR